MNSIVSNEQSLLASASDTEVTFRFLERIDYALGFPAVLSGLTKGCEYDEATFLKRFDQMFPSTDYKIIVLVSKKTGKIVGSGSLIIEKKFIRNAGLVSKSKFAKNICRPDTSRTLSFLRR